MDCIQSFLYFVLLIKVFPERETAFYGGLYNNLWVSALHPPPTCWLSVRFCPVGSVIATLCAGEFAFSVKFSKYINRTFGVFEWTSPCLSLSPLQSPARGPA